MSAPMHTPGPWVAEPMVTGAKGAFYIVGNREGNNAEVEVATVGPTLSPRAEANARRIVDCVNALAAIPDPAAFMEAARGMREALGRIATVDMGGGFLGAQACRQVASEAILAFDAAQGEQ